MATAIKSWGTATTPHSAVTLGTTQGETVSDAIDNVTGGYFGNQIRVDVTWHASATVNVMASIYASTDNSNFDDVPFQSVECSVSANTTKQLTFMVRDLAYFKIGIKHTANESNAAVVTVTQRPWRLEKP